MISPHTHPRASEFLFVINGTGIEVGFIEEDGARYVANTVLPGEATVFPKVIKVEVHSWKLF
jgi:mannose-6-phosphate isomerase-like protein (cupin superfamily)